MSRVRIRRTGTVGQQRRPNLKGFSIHTTTFLKKSSRWCVRSLAPYPLDGNYFILFPNDSPVGKKIDVRTFFIEFPSLFGESQKIFAPVSVHDDSVWHMLPKLERFKYLADSKRVDASVN